MATLVTFKEILNLIKVGCVASGSTQKATKVYTIFCLSVCFPERQERKKDNGGKQNKTNKKKKKKKKTETKLVFGLPEGRK